MTRREVHLVPPDTVTTEEGIVFTAVQSFTVIARGEVKTYVEFPDIDEGSE